MDALCWLLAAPVAYPLRWLAPLDRGDWLFAAGSQLVSLVPGLPGAYFRRAFYRIALRLRSAGFVIDFGTILAQRGIEIGNNAYIGAYCNIGLSVIGDDVLLGSGVHVVSGTRVHFFERVDVPIRDQGGELHKVRIGRDVWAGNQAVIMADVGDGAVVGAAALVNKPVKPYTVVGGNPARLIRKRGSDTEDRQAGQSIAEEGS